MQNQDELTPDEYELEQALKTLRPAHARIDPASAVLAAKRRANQRRVRIWQTAAALLLVAVGMWAAIGRSRQEQPRAAGAGDAEVQGIDRIADADVEPPTELVYRRALMRSSAAFDALLDQHSMMRRSPDIEVTRVGVALFWDGNLHLSSGDL